MADGEMGLAEAIDVVRCELRKAQDAGHDADVRFAVGQVEVELAVEVVKKAGGQASIKVLNLLSVGGKGGVSKGDVNRVKVVLNPIAVHGEPLEVVSEQHRRPDAIEESGDGPRSAH